MRMAKKLLQNKTEENTIAGRNWKLYSPPPAHYRYGKKKDSSSSSLLVILYAAVLLKKIYMRKEGSETVAPIFSLAARSKDSTMFKMILCCPKYLYTELQVQ